MDNNRSNFMKLDGSYGEGGGQILRTAIALSAVTGEPVEIYNIRKARPKSGLATQHVKAIKTLSSICDAEVEGCSLRSTHLIFKPSKIKGGTYDIDIGTAGSITLLLQCLMPAVVHGPSPVKLNIIGGTDVSWSPTIDYLRYVTLNALSQMGYECELRMIHRGYYPRGGGCIEATICPSTFKKLSFDKNQCNIIEGISHSSNIPSHVVQRQASAAEKILRDEGYKTNISLEIKDEVSTGSGITLWCGTAGGSALGKPGLRAEKVGTTAAVSILQELNTDAGVDIYLADQLLPYMALAGGGSFTTRVLTPHAKTNIWVIQQFLDVDFKIEEQDTGLFRVSI